MSSRASLSVKRRTTKSTSFMATCKLILSANLQLELLEDLSLRCIAWCCRASNANPSKYFKLTDANPTLKLIKER